MRECQVSDNMRECQTAEAKCRTRCRVNGRQQKLSFGQHARTVGFLAVTLQRQNFQVLAACAPVIAHEIEGRLGRPLSEDPEFWRAAPEGALQWSAKEFDFPDVRRDDSSEGREGADIGQGIQL